MIFPQPLLLLICALIPAYFIYYKKNNLGAIAWLAIVVMLDIFNSQAYMNLPAALIMGAVVLPYLFWNRTSLFKNKAVVLLCGYLALLGVLGIYHGWISPWPDLTGVRSFKDQAQLRSVLHFGRTFLEWACALFVLLELEKDSQKTTRMFLKASFFSAIALSIGALAEKWFQIDFYHFFTGGRALLIPHRPRGFAYEPRGLSQNLAYALLMLPFAPVGKWKLVLAPLFLFLAFGFTISFSGIAVFALGLAVLGLFFIRKKPKLFWGAAVGACVLLAITLKSLPESSQYYLKERFNYLTTSGIAEKLEVFDAAAVNFFIHEPKYLVLGTGPGLIYLPASEYIIERDKPIWGNRFEALPHMGAVLILSNAGIVGLIVFLFALWTGVKQHQNRNALSLVLGCVFMAIFMVQIRYFYLFGLAALLARKSKQAEPSFDRMIS